MHIALTLQGVIFKKAYQQCKYIHRKNFKRDLCVQQTTKTVSTLHIKIKKKHDKNFLQYDKTSKETKSHTTHATNIACTLISGSDSFSKCTTELPDCSGYETERIQVLADECDDKSATTGTCRWVPE